jgi:hypothetical protein
MKHPVAASDAAPIRQNVGTAEKATSVPENASRIGRGERAINIPSSPIIDMEDLDNPVVFIKP